MLTKFVLKLSLFVSAVTFIICMAKEISFQVSLIRAALVFVGFYSVLIAFFIGLRFVLVREREAGAKK
ncbi:MAG: hypothetical protein D6743_02450 [Calditrichaeota bacterium]|nr:MAG: hypothetical protein D6743_02450 [Calditrichota bacterium]